MLFGDDVGELRLLAVSLELGLDEFAEVGRRVGDRLGVDAATVLALIVLMVTGLYTVAAAARAVLS